MNSRYKRLTTFTASFLILVIVQIYGGVSFAQPAATLDTSAAESPQATAILTTRGNKPISVNGASAITGATIVPGALVETPDHVGATMNMSALGKLDMAPNTRLTLDFDFHGSVRVTLIQGCIVLYTKKGTTGEIDSSKGGVLGKTDPKEDGVLRTCTDGATGVPGVVSGAGAGAGGGLGGGAIAAILLGGGAAVVAIALALRGSNPSPSTP